MGKVGGACLAITPGAHRKLEAYASKCLRVGKALPKTIDLAVVLTDEQQAALTHILSEFWGRPYPCPNPIDVLPQHGYQSRVLKDGFSPEDYVLWLVAGCSDLAAAAVGVGGRPRLELPVTCDEKGRSYTLHTIISCDAHGRVHINDVIPKGLPPAKKKATPSAAPATVPVGR